MLRIEFRMERTGVMDALDAVVEAETNVECDNALPVNEHTWLMYATVTFERTTEEVSDIDAALDTASDVRPLRSQRVSSKPASYQVLLYVDQSTSLLTVITQNEAVPHRLVAEREEIRGVVSVRDWAHLKELAEAIEDTYESFELIGTTQADTIGYPLGADKMKSNLQGKLTERQIEVLETAYRMGYFEVPQRATSDEIAAELGISRSTLSERLRRSQDKLFGVFFGVPAQ